MFFRRRCGFEKYTAHSKGWLWPGVDIMYGDNFLLFSTIFGLKIGIFLEIQCHGHFLQKVLVVWEENGNCFGNFLAKLFFKIITSVWWLQRPSDGPGYVHMYSKIRRICFWHFIRLAPFVRKCFPFMWCLCEMSQFKLLQNIHILLLSNQENFMALKLWLCIYDYLLTYTEKSSKSDRFQLPQSKVAIIFWDMIPKPEKIYQRNTKCTKWS
jgi:hypothetical protein